MTRWLTLSAVLSGLFVALGITVAKQPLTVDLAVAGATQGLWRGTTGQVTTVVSNAFGSVVPDAFAMALPLAWVWCRYRRMWRELRVVARVLLVVLPCRLVSTVGKEAFGRARPRAYPEFSYPSGHVAAIAGTGLAAVLLCVWLAPRLTRRVALTCAIVTALVAATRLVLGVHWLTDTIGSVLGVLGVGLLVAAAVRLLPGPVPTVTSAA